MRLEPDFLVTMGANEMRPGESACREVASVKSDIAVYGGTPCGIAAALAATRFGGSVVLIAAGKHLGGMMTSGLSITDLRFPSAFGGVFACFKREVLGYYIKRYGRDSKQVADSNGGLWFEPHVAEEVFEQMLSSVENVRVFREQRLIEAQCRQGQVCSVIFEDRATGKRERCEARVFIDASYEGDLAALAGVEYRIGRESREDFWEPYAGKVFLKNPGLQLLPGSTGEGDGRIQAYNYRLCLTTREDIRVPFYRPERYDREEYLPLLELHRQGRIQTIRDVIRLAPIPNGKYSANNRPIVRSLDLPEENTDYPEADDEGRARIIQRYRDYTLGLLWFLRTDPGLSRDFRKDAEQWGFCADEFADNGYLPYEVYVREARRIVGRKTFTAHDVFLEPGKDRTPVHEDSVAVADYHVDSHIVHRAKPGWPQMEGHVYLRPISKPAQVPFGIMLPEAVEGLLVPGAVSATHLGFSVLRMEPAWMALGQAAGTAARLALELGVLPSEVPVKLLQRRLIETGQVLTFFCDFPGPDPVWELLNKPKERTKLDSIHVVNRLSTSYSPGMQYFGTKGFFSTYYSRADDPLTRSELVRWLCRLLEIERVNAETERANAATQTESVPFRDVSETHPDHQYVAQLYWLGLVSGGPGLGFYPGTAVSREEAARCVVRLKRLLLAKPGPRSVDDAENWLVSTACQGSHLELLGEMSLLPPTFGPGWESEPLSCITRREFCDLLYTVYFA